MGSGEAVGVNGPAQPDVAARVHSPSDAWHIPTTESQRPPRSSGFLTSLLDATPGIVVVSDTNGRLLYVNATGRETFGVDASADLRGRNAAEFYPEGGFDRMLTEAVPVALKYGVWRGESVLLGAGRTEIPVSQMLMAHHVSRGAGSEPIVALSSIAWTMQERSPAVARLRQQATHDALTALPNRMLLLDRLKQALSAARRHGHKVAVVFVDFDEFKCINDRFGHQAGSGVLAEFARRLRSGMRAEDTVARYGGDEFVLLVRDINAPIELVRARLLTAIYRALAAPFAVGDTWISPSVSAGVAAYPDDGRDAESLLHKADSSLHRIEQLVGNPGPDARGRRAVDRAADRA